MAECTASNVRLLPAWAAAPPSTRSHVPSACLLDEHVRQDARGTGHDKADSHLCSSGRDVAQHLLESLRVIRVAAKDLAASFKTLTFKHESTPLSAFVGSAIALGGLEIAQSYGMHGLGSFAALATLLFAAPAAPLGSPWNSILGHSVSIGVAVSFHWLRLLTGLDACAKVLAPSTAIAAMVHLKVTNPPAAAAAFIFSTSSLAQAQPGGGLAFLVQPYASLSIGPLHAILGSRTMSDAPPFAIPSHRALAGCAWLILCQYTLAKAVKWIKDRQGTSVPPPANAPKLNVDVSVVDPTEATCIILAVEGAAYVADPLTYIIETLARDRANLRRQRAVVGALLGESKAKALPSDVHERAAVKMQRVVRVIQATKKLVSEA